MPTELLTDPHHQRSDLRVVETSIKRGWTIPDAVLAALPTKLAALALQSEDERVRVAASRVLVAMHGQNLAQEKPAAVPPSVNVQVNIDADARRDRIREIAGRVRSARITDESAGG